MTDITMPEVKTFDFRPMGRMVMMLDGYEAVGELIDRVSKALNGKPDPVIAGSDLCKFIQEANMDDGRVILRIYVEPSEQLKALAEKLGVDHRGW